MNFTPDDTFLANISHEMRTPLNVILGFTRLLNDRRTTETDQKEYLQIIESSSVQLLTIVDEILDLAKATTGNMRTEMISFCLPQFLKDFIGSMAPAAAQKKLSLELIIKNDLPEFVMTDPTRLRQILSNVIGNAIKFTEAGKVELEVSAVDGILTLQVTDTGCGIDHKSQELIFAPFKQADSTITRKYGGHGLGLVITAKICQLLGGDFYLKESQTGVGSQFVAKIAFKESNNSIEGKLNGADCSSIDGTTMLLKGKNILLVEDCPDNQKLVSIYLKNQGASISVACDGIEGLKKLAEGRFDAVLMDVQMPKMDGLQAVAKLREYNCKTPVIALTAHAMKESRDECFRAGYSDFLTKPVRCEDLIRTILQNLTH